MPRKKVTPLVAFLIGTGAAITLYAVFVIRHFDECVAFMDSYTAGQTLLMVFCLLFVAAAAGAHTWWSKPTSHKNAFTMGLGIPGLLLAADLGSGGGGGAETASASTLQLLASADRSATRLVLSPFSAVASVRAERHIRDAQAQAEKARKSTKAAIATWQKQIGAEFNKTTVAIEIKDAVEPTVMDLDKLLKECFNNGKRLPRGSWAREYLMTTVPGKLDKSIKALRASAKKASTDYKSATSSFQRTLAAAPTLNKTIRYVPKLNKALFKKPSR